MPTALEQRFTVRPPVDEDIRAIIELVMALDLLHYGVADEYAPDDIRDDWSHLNRETDAWAVVAPDGQLAAYATVTDHGFGRIEADGYVHPNFQGQGIGTELVRLMETRARLHSQRAGTRPRRSYQLRVAVGYPSATHHGGRGFWAGARFLAHGD